MGKTGIYFNYVHYLLTSPKMGKYTDKEGKELDVPIRWSYPQILATTVLAVFIMGSHRRGAGGPDFGPKSAPSAPLNLKLTKSPYNS